MLCTGIAVAVVLLYPDPAFARDLGGAAKTAVSMAKTVTRTLSVFGLLVGAFILQVPGLADFGKRTMQASLVGCLCAFGGPAIISFFEGVFGGM